MKQILVTTLRVQTTWLNQLDNERRVSKQISKSLTKPQEYLLVPESHKLLPKERKHR